MDSKNKLKKGMARIQFFAVNEEIKKLFAAGYSIKLAYEHLKEAGRITMSYRAFYDNLNSNKKKQALLPPRQQQLQKPEKRKLGVGNTEPTIKHDKKPHQDDVI